MKFNFKVQRHCIWDSSLAKEDWRQFSHAKTRFVLYANICPIEGVRDKKVKEDKNCGWG